MTRKEDPYMQGLIVSGIIGGWILLIAVFMQLDKPVIPKLFESITSIFS